MFRDAIELSQTILDEIHRVDAERLSASAAAPPRATAAAAGSHTRPFIAPRSATAGSASIGDSPNSQHLLPTAVSAVGVAGPNLAPAGSFVPPSVSSSVASSMSATLQPGGAPDGGGGPYREPSPSAPASAAVLAAAAAVGFDEHSFAANRRRVDDLLTSFATSTGGGVSSRLQQPPPPRSSSVPQHSGAVYAPGGSAMVSTPRSASNQQHRHAAAALVPSLSTADKQMMREAQSEVAELRRALLAATDAVTRAQSEQRAERLRADLLASEKARAVKGLQTVAAMLEQREAEIAVQQRDASNELRDVRAKLAASQEALDLTSRQLSGANAELQRERDRYLAILDELRVAKSDAAQLAEENALLRAFAERRCEVLSSLSRFVRGPMAEFVSDANAFQDTFAAMRVDEDGRLLLPADQVHGLIAANAAANGSRGTTPQKKKKQQKADEDADDSDSSLLARVPLTHPAWNELPSQRAAAAAATGGTQRKPKAASVPSNKKPHTGAAAAASSSAPARGDRFYAEHLLSEAALNRRVAELLARGRTLNVSGGSAPAPSTSGAGSSSDSESSAE